ncbi:unnamed protein product [Cuscuta campestris]|uniref:Pectinesterase n=1 Tax=Cuscuta campestris TaxID=132261 RepID=A0A484LVJ3_9ASTE|nr:unnamed protein product [Cuscuta campestris]
MFRSLLTCLIISSLSFRAAPSDKIYEAAAAVQGGDRDIHWWCSTTTHPETCSHHMTGRFGHNFKPKCRFKFRDMAVRVALERALETQQTAARILDDVRADRSIGRFDNMVQMDCHKLIEITVLQLNRTLESFRSDSPSTFRAYSDTQTWLSTALTNIETCRSGCAEVNVSYDVVGPIVSQNISELISNSLAVNGALMDEHRQSSSITTTTTTTIGDKFPSWVTPGERRLLQSSTPSLESGADSIVSKNGTGHFRSVQDAIDHATTTMSKRKGNRRVVIYIKKGVYKENVVISTWMSRITLVGDGYNETIITGERSVGGGYTTYSSATFGVDGPQFMARGITFQNTAGPQRGQAVALRSASDLSVFYECSFEGYQDTLFVLAQRQFYKSCQIYGTVDFVFGNAAAVLQDCTFYVRKPLWGQINVVTAQGRADPYQNTGISIHNCRITAGPDLRPVARSYQTYLGRPWQRHSRTVVLKSYIDDHVNPQGWLRWRNSDFALTTLYYGEYMNSGPGATTALRVKWPGYHVITDSEVASNFTVSNLIAGETWLPSTGVPFTAGL